jgi:putative DNA primase/helicase
MTLFNEVLEALVTEALAENADYWRDDGRMVTAIAASLASYDPAIRSTGKADYEVIKKRFQAKFRAEFSTTEMKARLEAEVHRLKREAQAMKAEDKERRGHRWEDGLLRKATRDPDSAGAVLPCEHNAILYMTHHKDWKNSLGYDLFTDTHLVLRDLPIGVKEGDRLLDHHDTLVQAWFQTNTNESAWRLDAVRRAIDCVAKANSSHVIKDYLAALVWDGVERCPTWLEYYCGAGPAEGSDASLDVARAAYIRAVAVRWLISMVARIIDPGCKVDHVLVLEGMKGIGKTTLVDILFGGRFAMISGDVASKDSQILVSGNWGVLMDELDVLGKSEMRAVKSFVTRQTEKYRPVFGIKMIDRPRQCVFIATVNGDDWAMEEDRRWWPIACHGMFKLTELKADRDQLLAEAVARYQRGERWHLDADEDEAIIETAKCEQAARVQEQVNDTTYVRTANEWLHRAIIPRTVSIEEIFNAMDPPASLGDRRRFQGEVGKALRQAGWVRERFTIKGQVTWRYRAPAVKLFEDD